MTSSALPRVFIGSSVEALDIAYALQMNIEFDAEPTVWTQGIFKPSSSALVDLVNGLNQFDFAVFVFNTDDVVLMRNQKLEALRDNVLFELGLFIGKLGLDRCFVLKARDTQNFHLPTDLMGFEALTFHAHRSDKNLQAALGPAAHRLRERFSKWQAIAAPQTSSRSTLQRYMDLWNSKVLLQDREHARNGLASNVIEDSGDGRDHQVLSRLMAFVETVCDSSLRGEIDPSELNLALGQEIRAIYAHAQHFWRNAVHDGDAWTSTIVLAWLHRTDTKG